MNMALALKKCSDLAMRMRPSTATFFQMWPSFQKVCPPLG